jgi:hypothetical protein
MEAHGLKLSPNRSTIQKVQAIHLKMDRVNRQGYGDKGLLGLWRTKWRERMNPSEIAAIVLSLTAKAHSAPSRKPLLYSFNPKKERGLVVLFAF